MNKPNHRSRPSPPWPSLRFSPYAWAKLLHLRDQGDTEIGGFGLSAPGDPLLIEDVLLIKQRCSVATVIFDDEAVADYFDQMVDQGLEPEQFARVWIHTHPGNCPLPSSVVEETFDRVFGPTDWSVMAIVARNDDSYARLQFQAGPGGAWEIPVEVDYRHSFAGSQADVWSEEYRNLVTVERPLPKLTTTTPPAVPVPDDWPYSTWEWEEYNDGELSPGSF